MPRRGMSFTLVSVFTDVVGLDLSAIVRAEDIRRNADFVEYFLASRFVTRKHGLGGARTGIKQKSVVLIQSTALIGG